MLTTGGAAYHLKSRMAASFPWQRGLDLFRRRRRGRRRADWRRGERRDSSPRESRSGNVKLPQPPGGGKKWTSGLDQFGQNVGRIRRVRSNLRAGDRRRRRWQLTAHEAPLLKLRHYGHRRARIVAKIKFSAITPRRRARSTISTSFLFSKLVQIVGYAKADEMCTTATRTCRRRSNQDVKLAIAAEASTKRYAGDEQLRAGSGRSTAKSCWSGSRRTRSSRRRSNSQQHTPFTAAGCSTPGFRHRNGSITAKSAADAPSSI